MGIERAWIDVLECLSAYSNQVPTFRDGRLPNQMEILGGKYGTRHTYPGSFSVLFIEYAKCFATEVKSSGR